MNWMNELYFHINILTDSSHMNRLIKKGSFEKWKEKALQRSTWAELYMTQILYTLCNEIVLYVYLFTSFKWRALLSFDTFRGSQL